MAVFNKPQFNTVWASQGVRSDPGVAKVGQGWVVEIPPHEYANWLDNRRDAMLAHINQVGIVAWDGSVEYQSGKSYVQSPSGTVFKALTTHTGVDPDLDVNGNWEVAFQRSGEALLKSQNLADVPDKAQARSNLGIATTADYDSRFLRQVQNLADLPSKSTARGNLDVYSRQEVIDLLNNIQPAGEVAPFARNTAPDGWLVCDGSVVSRTTYARLFAAIGVRFGGGNGSSTFQLPDLRGEFIRGWDGGRNTDVGRVFGTQQNDTIQNIVGNVVGSPDTLYQFLGEDVTASGVFRVTNRTASSFADGGASTVQASSITFDASRVVRTSSETRPRNIALLYCIRT